MTNAKWFDALDYLEPELLDKTYLQSERIAKRNRTVRRVFVPTGSAVAAVAVFVAVLLIWNRPGAGLADPISGSDPVAASTLAFDPVPVSDAARPDALDVVYLPGLALPGASTETVQFAGLSVSEPLYEALTENRNQYYCIRVDGADASDVETFRDAGVFFEVVNDTLYIYPTEEQLETLNGISGTLGESRTFSLSTDPVIGEAWEKYVVQRQFGNNPYISSSLDKTSVTWNIAMIRDPALVGQFLDLLLSLEDYLVCPIALSDEDAFRVLVDASAGHGRIQVGDDSDLLLFVIFGTDFIIVGTDVEPVLTSEGYLERLQFTHVAEFRINADPKPLVDTLKEIPVIMNDIPRLPEQYEHLMPPSSNTEEND